MKKKNVLILDKEKKILNAAERIFRDEPYGIFVTTDYKEAFDVMEKEEIKVVVSAQHMPGISGVEFLVKARRRFPNAGRILVTGHGDLKIAEDAINKGAVYRFINKPWSDTDLKTAVKTGIERYDMIKKNQRLVRKIKKQNESLLEVNQKLGRMYVGQKEFSSNVSHELRTPLAAIKAILDMIISGTTGEINECQRDFLGRALTSVDRLHRLINDVLTLSRLESGKKELCLDSTDMNALIMEVAEIQKYVAKKKDLYLKTELSADVPATRFDGDKIRQVMYNLIDNAIKFTEKGGIVLSSARDGDHIRISVRDTGPGMREKDKNRLFKKFQQLGDPSRRKTGGTGLGLAISKEIVVQHGGKIGVESHLGKGSVFTFFLPVRE